MFDLRDKIIFVTGGALGIGAASVTYFLKENVKHVAVIDVNEKAGKDLERELNSKYGGRVEFIKCDVTNEDELFAAYKNVIDEHGYIDVVVNNAGIMNDNPARYKTAIDLNYKALVTSSFKARELMRKDRSGRGGVILNVSSIAALLQAPYVPVYFSTKSAILQFSNCLGSTVQYEKTGVKVITICFGLTDTTILNNPNISFDEDFREDFREYIKTLTLQSTDSAAKGLVETCKQAETGSTWLSKNDKPVEDITWAVKKAYSVFEEVL